MWETGHSVLLRCAFVCKGFSFASSRSRFNSCRLYICLEYRTVNNANVSLMGQGWRPVHQYALENVRMHQGDLVDDGTGTVP